MKKKQLKHYLDKEWKMAQQWLKNFVDEGEKEALHRFRVQIKKLRAFITLARETEAGKGLKKDFKPVRNIFQKAGTIRDAQLRITLGKEQKAGRDYIAKQKRQLYENTRRFRLQGKRYLKRTNKSHKEVGRHVKPMADKDIRNYYNDQLHWVSENISGSTALLHPCRKRLKVLIYGYKFAGKALKQDIDKDYLKALEKSIGDWHDNCLSCRLFPALQQREQGLLDKVHNLSENFYNRTTGKAS
jgi:CHAD domain-containing protein